jgi:hypothetical protein
MSYTLDEQRRLSELHALLCEGYEKTWFLANIFCEALTWYPKSATWTDGVLPRLYIIHRSLQNIFKIFPPERSAALENDSLLDLEINLMAFIVNVPGILENIASTLEYVNEIVVDPEKSEQSPIRACLFDAAFTRLLHPAIHQYMQTELVQKWCMEYVSGYRSAVESELPLHISPFGFDDGGEVEFERLNKALFDSRHVSDSDSDKRLRRERDSYKKASPIVVLSFSEAGQTTFLHQRLLQDFEIVSNIVRLAVKYYSVKIEASDLNRSKT